MSTIYPGLVPVGLRTTEFVLRPITADDAEKDHAALMETREELRLWEQSTWPEDDFTVEANRADLAGLAERHADRRAFTYTVLAPDENECLGCVYVFPTGASFLAKSAVTAVGDDEWADVDVVVYVWVRRTQMKKGLDDRLLAALRAWFADEWKVNRAVFVTNEQFTQQVDRIRRTDLILKFELVEPGKPGTYLVYG
ncbi:GNAT family N-acetyltransferase [Leifsonia sp. NPDC058292]|uniref:GNAT family N-acetyltransferase n=1 Tax=Leifsonia sp. NPDC058292 TaxID=3346428 RepID=UPI0036D9974E